MERLRGSSKLLFLFLILLLGGGILGYSTFALSLGTPKIGIIKFSGIIEGMETSDKINTMLRYAGEKRDIKAVVLEIESPGGGATSSEEIYLNVLTLREKKPVVTSIGGIGASGGYFIAAGSDYIFAKPSSSVGSIGVRAGFPRAVSPDEETLTTGPLKRSGFTMEDFVRDLEIVKEVFLRSVISQRGDRLKLDKEELSKAGIYSGVEAKRFGLVDELGSNTDAYEKAASLAGVKRYRAINLNDELNISFADQNVFFVNGSLIKDTNTAPVFYFIYMDPG